MTTSDGEGSELDRTLLGAAAASRGHFLYESGHHGDLWLNLDMLFLDARLAQGWASALAHRAMACRPQFVCGPLTGGAFVAQSLAAELGAGFVFAERFVLQGEPVYYRVPEPLRGTLRGGRVLLVDDVVNAGSALRSTLTDLQECGAELAGLASLLTLGKAAARIAKQHGVPLYALASLERGMWAPDECPLCGAGVPLADRLAR